MTVTLCPHGDIEAACLDCLHERPAGPDPERPQRPKPVDPWTWVVARYDGHCRGCNLPIQTGERIIAMTDDTWQHARCVS